MLTLPRRLSHCVLEGERFEQGMEYISCLDLLGQRKDYCVECWKKLTSPSEAHFWKGTIPTKKNKVLRPDEKALQLLRATDEPKQRFVLALYLQRKQQLVRRTHTLYEVPETGEVFDIEYFQLSLEEGETLALAIEGQLSDGSIS